MLHPDVAPALSRHVRGALVARGDRAPRRARDHDGRTAARARLRRRPRRWSRSGCATTGATTRSAIFAPEPRYSRRRRSDEFKTTGQEPARRRDRSHPRRRLQPHGRRQPARPDALVSRHRQRVVLPARAGDRALLRRRDRLRQHARPAPSARAADGDGLAALLGRARCTSTASASISRRRSRASDSGRSTGNAASSKAIQQDPVLARAQADRRTVGSRPRAAIRSATSRPAGRSGTTGIATPCGASGAATTASSPISRSRLTGSSDLFEQQRPPPAREHQLRHRARRLHAAPISSVQPQTQRGEPRGQPRRHRRQRELELRRRGSDRRSRRSSRCARSRSATSSRRCLLSLGVPMLLGRRRVRAHAAREQQRVLPGQRD